MSATFSYNNIVGFAETIVSGWATSVDIAIPEGVEAGDHILLLVSLRQSDTSPPAPTGFTRIFFDRGTAVAIGFDKVAAGNEGGTSVTFTYTESTNTGSAVAFAIIVRGVDFGAEAVVANPPPSPDLTPTWSQQTTLWIPFLMDRSNYGGTAAPTGFTDFYRADALDGGSSTLSIATDQSTETTKSVGTWPTDGSSSPRAGLVGYAITELVTGTFGIRITDIKDPNNANSAHPNVASSVTVKVWLGGDDDIEETLYENQSITDGTLEIEVPGSDTSQTGVIVIAEWEQAVGDHRFFKTSTDIIELGGGT